MQNKKYSMLEDVYTMNVSSFRKRLLRDTVIESISTIYLIIIAIGIMHSFFASINSPRATIYVLVLFLFLTVSKGMKCSKFVEAYKELKNDFTNETCMSIAEETYDLDYTAYYESHQNRTFEEILPERPRFYNIFSIVSIAFAAVTTFIGIVLFIMSINQILVYGISAFTGFECISNFVYSTLAIYFGIKDIFTSIYS